MNFFYFMRMLVVCMSLLVFGASMTFVFWAYQRTDAVLAKVEAMSAAYDMTQASLDTMSRGRHD